MRSQALGKAVSGCVSQPLGAWGWPCLSKGSEAEPMSWEVTQTDRLGDALHPGSLYELCFGMLDQEVQRQVARESYNRGGDYVVWAFDFGKGMISDRQAPCLAISRSLFFSL